MSLKKILFLSQVTVILKIWCYAITFKINQIILIGYEVMDQSELIEVNMRVSVPQVIFHLRHNIISWCLLNLNFPSSFISFVSHSCIRTSYRIGGGAICIYFLSSLFPIIFHESSAEGNFAEKSTKK